MPPKWHPFLYSCAITNNEPLGERLLEIEIKRGLVHTKNKSLRWAEKKSGE